MSLGCLQVEAGVSMGSGAYSSARTKGKVAVDNLKGRVQKTLGNGYGTQLLHPCKLFFLFRDFNA
jgi:hypothetical protein